MMAQYREKLIEEGSSGFQSTQVGLDITNVEMGNPIYLHPNLNSTSVMTTCGHIMHDHCWSSHMETVVNKERRRPYRLRHPLSFDVDKLEWLCPMCDSICNAALPMAVDLSKIYNLSTPSPEVGSKYESDPSASFDTLMQGLQFVVQNRAVGFKMNAAEQYAAWAMKKWGLTEENLMVNLVSFKDISAVGAGLDRAEALTHFTDNFPVRKFIDGELSHKWLYSGFHRSFNTFMSRNYHVSGKPG